MFSTSFILAATLPMVILANAAFADSKDDDENACEGLPSHSELTTALKASVIPYLGPMSANGGFGTNMWAAVVNRDGVVCAITRSDDVRTNQWPGSRVIAVQKANTANSFSLPNLALSTTNLYAASQPDKWASGLQFSNPIRPDTAYRGKPKKYGTRKDPMVGRILGGVNVFAGGLALYTESGALIGAIGASGDTSCADHNVAWRTRDALGLDHVPAGIPEALGGGAPLPLPPAITQAGDNILYDFATLASGIPELLSPGTPGFSDQQSLTGFGHPVCLGNSDRTVNAAVVDAHPLGENP